MMEDSRKLYFQISSLESAGIRTLEEGMRGLELLADKEAVTLTKVNEELGFNRTKSHRDLATLTKLA